MKRALETPKYLQIAADIAGKIVSGDYHTGDRLFARSTLAVKYGVSSETARRAIALLADVGIVSVVKGSGCTVASIEKAEAFRNQYRDYDSVHSLQESLSEQVARQKENLLELEETMQKLSQYLAKYQHANPLIPMKTTLTEKCLYLGKTIGELNLWQHTGVTVVALGRDGIMQVSPGPYADFRAGDDVYFIGVTDSWQRMMNFLYGDMQ